MKNKVNKWTMLWASALLIVAGVSHNPAMSQDSGQLKIPLSNPDGRGKLTVDIRSGSIMVTGTNVKEVIVNYTSREKKMKEKEVSRDGLTRIGSGGLDLEAYESNNMVEVESDSWNQGVDLDIQVPINFDLHLETYNNGVIHAKNIVGNVEADNYNGKVTLENISGSAVVDTYNGAIVVTFDKVTPDTPMAFTTYNGHVDLTLPASTRASFKMKSKMGDIFEGFGMEVAKTQPVIQSEKSSKGYQVKIDDWVRGDINGGGAEIVMQNYNGNLYVRKGS